MDSSSIGEHIAMLLLGYLSLRRQPTVRVTSCKQIEANGAAIDNLI